MTATMNVTDPTPPAQRHGRLSFSQARRQMVLNQYWRDTYRSLGYQLLRHASGLGRYRRREALIAALSQNPEVDLLRG
jgi:hypothetical protein